jgi:hypothetical protein
MAQYSIHRPLSFCFCRVNANITFSSAVIMNPQTVGEPLQSHDKSFKQRRSDHPRNPCADSYALLTLSFNSIAGEGVS